jgi:hypothetical protein
MSIDLSERLDRIEEMLQTLIRQRTLKEWYSVEEFSEIVGRAPFTIREAARLGRIAARKANGRGEFGEWRISHAELVRFQNEGYLPDPRQRRLRRTL